MAAVNPGERVVIGAQTALLLGLYLFLYFPIFYIGYLSLMDNSVWPFPPVFTGAWYARLMIMSDFHTGLLNSVFIGAGTAVLSTLFATTAAIGILRYPVRRRGSIVVLFLAPLFVAQVLIGISTLMFNRNVLGIPGNIESAIVANTTYSVSFAFLVILAQLVRYDWRFDEVAQVFGARPMRCFREVTFPNIWPAILGAFLISFILGTISSRSPTSGRPFSAPSSSASFSVSTISRSPFTTWPPFEPELYALATIVNALVFLLLFIIYLLIRVGALRLGVPGK